MSACRSSKRMSNLGVLKRRLERATARRQIEELGIVCRSEKDEMSALSGGNQQKVMVARWMAQDATLFILDEPFQGVDISARRDIAAKLRASAMAARRFCSSPNSTRRWRRPTASWSCRSTRSSANTAMPMSISTACWPRSPAGRCTARPEVATDELEWREHGFELGTEWAAARGSAE